MRSTTGGRSSCPLPSAPFPLSSVICRLTAELTLKAHKLGWAPYLLLLPSLAFLAIFFAAPMIQAFGLAFQNGDGEWSTVSIRTMLDDAAFWRSLRTTLLLIVLVIPIQFTLAMTMALVVNAKLKGSGLWLYIFAIPLGISELSAGIIWFAIFTERGWLNSFLEGLGIVDRPIIFLNYQEPLLILLAIVLAEAWRATSIIMIILVAGLQSIPKDYLEAADMLGATTWQKIWRVILPLLRPSIQVALILRTILAFQVFATVIALAGRGLTTLSAESYRWYGDLQNSNVAAAYASLILLLSVISTLFFLWLVPANQDRV
ncbi:MAG: sugar ABC transporter permease [Chloroflexia bacterium]|nr:sugar ABC transporter permease [Chloroflexia bacterium]